MYSLFNRNIEKDILPTARELGIGVVAFGTLAHGLLAGSWTKERIERSKGGYIPLYFEGNIEKNVAMLVTWMSVIISPKNSESIINHICMFVFFITYTICIIHSFKIRKEYLIRLEVMEIQKIEESEIDSLRSKVSNEYGVKSSKISTGKLSNTKESNN